MSQIANYSKHRKKKPRNKCQHVSIHSLSALEKSENFNTVNQALAAAIQSLMSSLYYSRRWSVFCTRHVHLCNETLLFSAFSWEVQRVFPGI